MTPIRVFLVCLVLILGPGMAQGWAQPAVPPLPDPSAVSQQAPEATAPVAPARPVLPHAARPKTPSLSHEILKSVRPGAAPDTVVPTAELAGLVPKDEAKTAEVVRIALILTLMAILPAILLCMTSFVRIIVVLSMIRHGLGMPETPPNQVLVSLAVFLTLFSMMPTFVAVNDQALQPFLAGKLSISEAMDHGTGPARNFMLRQVRDQDIRAVYDIAHKPLPDKAGDVELLQLVPAFMLNELRVSFRIGFVILLPFVLIDLVVSSILLSLGMLMVPPTTLSLPIKILMFVLIDGWSLILQGVLGSFR
jgi:flagellar biosynthetic protein FliP